MEMVFRNVSGLLDAQDALYAERKLARLNRLLTESGKVEVVHGQSGQAHKVTLAVWSPTLTVRCEESHESFRAAVDLALDKLKTRIRRQKDRAAN